MLKIEYKAETEDDLTDLLDSLLMVRSTAFMAQQFVFLHAELSEGATTNCKRLWTRS